MNCAACQRECRITKMASVVCEDGVLRSRRVCKACFDRALHIVARVTIATKPTDETKAARREAKEITEKASRKLRSMAAAYHGSDREGAKERAYGLEQAADILEAGDY